MTPAEAYERLKQPRISPADEAACSDTLTNVVMTGLAVGLLAIFAALVVFFLAWLWRAAK
jgi:hypothetical protein